MLVLRADEMGMCFGVRDALAALDRVADPEAVTIHGEVVHNPEVLALLDRRGFRRSDEAARTVPQTPVVAITAHGISERERARLLAAGKQLIDTTCPLVVRAHEAAQRFAAAGARVIVLGRPNHVEVCGIVEDLPDPLVVSGHGDVAAWPQTLFGVVCQTTTRVETARELLAAIRAANPHAEVRFADTICAPTKARIDALEALLPHVDALVVVGGHDSNNTRQLALRAEQRSVRALHVAHVRELVPGWFDGVTAVGLTAGTSTLPRTIDEVHGWLVRLGAQRRGRSA
ncbi:MAG: 4-hydroxy-3-methylbut-2-enyl diphosphate reductase [Planctomycetota bacterium]